MRMKHFGILIGASLVISIVGFTTVTAQGLEELYLKLIETHTKATATNTTDLSSNANKTAIFTGGILEKVNGIPDYIIAMGKYIDSWIAPMKVDKTPSLSDMQQSFGQLGELIIKGQADQLSSLHDLDSYLLSNKVDNVEGKNVYNANAGTSGSSQPDQKELWYANDLTYSTLLGKPYWPKDPRKKGESEIPSALNYIKNASGLNLFHKIPNPTWDEDAAATLRYQSYFNTIMSVESFNAYVLTNQLVEGNKLNTLQTTLVTQATDPVKWIAEVATENIGYVLRQMLLYESQIFVLLTQMLQLQKQMVTAQAMNNALIIAVNQMNENLMTTSAAGEQPSL